MEVGNVSDPAKKRDPFIMRARCGKCGCNEGRIEERGAQDVVRCADCNTFQYNAPRVETGKAVRSVSTVHDAVKPRVRAQVLMRANGRCEVCGRRPEGSTSELHVGHVISVKRAMEVGLPDDAINHDENLMALCSACNLGLGKDVIPVRFVVSVLMARLGMVKQ